MSIADSSLIPAFGLVPWVDRGLSDDARTMHDLSVAAAEFRGSIAVGEPKRSAQEALNAAYAAELERSDTVSESRVEPSTYTYAVQFLEILPTSVPTPDIAVDTDGEILFEWDRGPRHVFSVSVGRDGTLNFAGLFGHRKIHGTDHLREALPPVVQDCLSRIAAALGR